MSNNVTTDSLAARFALNRALPISLKLRLALEVLAAYAVARWLLLRKTLPEAVAELRRGIADDELRDGLVEQATGLRLGRTVVRVLTVLPTDSRCLVRSLVLTRLLARRRIASKLVIAVKSPPDFGAHAWVESGGRSLLPPSEPSYSRLLEL